MEEPRKPTHRLTPQELYEINIDFLKKEIAKIAPQIVDALEAGNIKDLSKTTMEAFAYALTGMLPPKLIHEVYAASGAFMVAEVVDNKGGTEVGEIEGRKYFVKPYHGQKRRKRNAYARYLQASKKL